jgi:hypothetical protein
MRCKRCGIALEQDGELCQNCLDLAKKENKLKNDNKELLRIKKKYSPKYILTEKLFEIYLIFLLLILVCIYSKNVFGTVLFILSLIVIIISVLAISKRNAKKTYMAFYENKIVFKGKMLFMNVDRTIKYEDVKDIVFTQGSGWFEKIFQKMFKLGNIYVYPKKGNLLTNGMQIEIVADIENVIEKIKSVVGDKLK